MFLISKKRISIIVIAIILGIFSFSISLEEKTEDRTSMTSSLPASGRVIVLDAGHGIPDEGDCLLH